MLFGVFQGGHGNAGVHRGLDDLGDRAVGGGLVESPVGRDHRAARDLHRLEADPATGGGALAETVPAVDHRQPGVVARDKGNVRLVVLVHRHRRDYMGEQGAGAVGLLTVDPRLLAGKTDLRLEGPDVLAAGFGKRIAEALPLQHLGEVMALLLLAGGLQQDVHHPQVVLR